LPGCGDPVRGSGRDGDLLARSAPQHGWLCGQAAGWGHAIEAHRDMVLALHGARWDITLDELRRKLAQSRVSVAISTLHRFFARHEITRKKDRPNVLNAREAWFEGQLDLDPERLVFINEI